ncbi:MAG: LutB/LldF family L-lactate oxidation iron-sulfur protein [Chloroflexi bacterium]|nr:LutB/LldF family L-lactate oxidation iron-sulfur protein [Chloroflexota bacterium]
MTSPFLIEARKAIEDPQLQELLDRNADTRRERRVNALRQLPDAEHLRERAKAIRRETISNLAVHLDKFTKRLSENGFHIHRASDGEEASRMVIEIAKKHGAELVAKSKSMVTEEIGLNEALASAGIRAVETDLGEYIVQLRGEPPAHILTPALHLTKEQVAETLSKQLGEVVLPDVAEINRTARNSLRKVFFNAPIGLTGVNFGVAETGTLCMVTNEGNGRMVTSLPPVHIAVMGIERLVPTLKDLAVMLRLLPRSATGQKITNYVSLINSPRRDTDPDGAEERHVILVDNGRGALLGTPLAESLDCIRCGACLNACPVFREAGGHAYGSVYSGPIGSVVSPALFGISEFGHLAKASSLCGACVEACPVGIDIPSMLLRVRAAAPPASRSIERGLKTYAWLARSPTRFRWAQRLAALAIRFLPTQAGWITSLPGPAAEWTSFRDFPAFSTRPLRARLGKMRLDVQPRSPEIEPPAETIPLPEKDLDESKVDDFEVELKELGGEVIRCSEGNAVDRIVGELYGLGVSRVLTWGQVEPILTTTLQRLEEEFQVMLPELPTDGSRSELLAEYDQAEVGITGSLAAFADTGTVVLSTASRRSFLPSLLPAVHLVIVRARDIYPNMETWLEAGGAQTIVDSSSVVFISGPSRTADIEMTLTIGVHGPGQVIAVVIE